MNSERRYRLYDITSHLFLTYMSFLLIISSVFSDELRLTIEYLDKITATLALFIFTTSLIIYAFKFSERADKYRECYLRLQGLEQSFDNEKDAVGAYQEILSGYPNHSPTDYEDLVLDRTFFGNRTLQTDGEPIKWTSWMLLKKVLRFITFWLVVLAPPCVTTLIFVLSIFHDPSGTQ